MGLTESNTVSWGEGEEQGRTTEDIQCKRGAIVPAARRPRVATTNPPFFLWYVWDPGCRKAYTAGGSSSSKRHISQEKAQRLCLCPRWSAPGWRSFVAERMTDCRRARGRGTTRGKITPLPQRRFIGDNFVFYCVPSFVHDRSVGGGRMIVQTFGHSPFWSSLASSGIKSDIPFCFFLPTTRVARYRSE